MRPLIVLLSLTAVGCHLISGLDEPIRRDTSGCAGAAGSCETSDYRAEVLADAPVGYWRLSDTGNDAADEVGRTIGEYVGDVTQQQTGALIDDPDTAVQFEGPNAVIRFADVFDLEMFSIEVWIKIPADTIGHHWILSKATTNTGGVPIEGYGLYFHEVDGITLDIVGSAFHSNAYAHGVAFDKWLHVVATFDGTDGLLYVDGLLVDSVIVNMAPMDHDGSFLIGAIDETGGGAFVGGLDEVAIYDHALLSERVTAHFTAGTD